MQKHVNLVDLVKSFPTNIFLQNITFSFFSFIFLSSDFLKIWRRYRRERALSSLLIWLKNQGKIRNRTFQRSREPREAERLAVRGLRARDVPRGEERVASCAQFARPRSDVFPRRRVEDLDRVPKYEIQSKSIK